MRPAAERVSAAVSGLRSPHRAWIEIDHAALRHNLALLHGRAGLDRQVIGVVKANAYGHGDVEVARTLVHSGVERLGVATLDEGMRLREAGIEVPILILWGLGSGEATAVARAVALEAVVQRADDVAMLATAAAAASDGQRIAFHLKVDTGLLRQGVSVDEAATVALEAVRSRHLRLVGTFTHLAVPGEDDAFTEVQLLRFAQALDRMRSAGVDPGLVHVAGTGGLLAGAGSFADAVRPGLGLYGMLPAWAADHALALSPVLSLKALPLRIEEIAPGTAVGYGLRWRANRRARIATLGIGYGDGWPRSHANNGFALVRGRRVPMVGAISMDGLTLDLDADDVTYGDEFVLIGEQGGARITAEEVAAQRRTINYEVTTALRRRLPRVHLQSER